MFLQLCTKTNQNWGLILEKNRTLLLPVINGSQARKVRLLDFFLSKSTVSFSKQIHWKTFNKMIQFVNRSQIQKLNSLGVFDTRNH